MNPLDPLKPADFDFEEVSEQQFEHQSVVLLSQHLLGKRYSRELVDETGYCTFTRISDYITLPVQLWSHKVKVPLFRCDKSVHPVWFKRDFMKIPVVQTYLKGQGGQATKALFAGKPEGMVFPRKGIKYGLIIHNAGMDYVVNGCHVFKVTEDCRLIVQPYVDFVKQLAVSKRWAINE